MSNNVVNDAAGKPREDENTLNQGQGDGISIHIDSDSESEISDREQARLLPRQHCINMEREDISTTYNVEQELNRAGLSRVERNVPSNLFSLFNNQLRRQRSSPGETTRQQQPRQPSNVRSSLGNIAAGSNNSENPRNVRFWINLNDVLSFSSVPSPEAIRSLFTHSSNTQFAANTANENPTQSDIAPPSTADNINQSVQIQRVSSTSHSASTTSALRENARIVVPRSVSLRDGEPLQTDSLNSTGRFSAPSILNNANDSEVVTRPRHAQSIENTVHRNHNAGTGSGASNSGGEAIQHDEDTNALSEIFVKFLSHFVRYLPFLCILLIKFLHDYFLPIFDLLFMHSVMYNMNKSLRTQVAKLSQKNYGILFRDLGAILFVVGYHMLLAPTAPDPFGLLIPPPVRVDSSLPSEKLHLSTSPTNDNLITGQQSLPENVNTVENVSPKAVSFGVLLYYVALNDAILRLLTIFFKIWITVLPVRIIRHKARARLYVLLEYLSQFYRAAAPLRQWLIFFFESYSGLEVVSGVVFSSFYLGAKGFEFVERGKSLRNAVVNFVRNMDNERTPTKDELEAAGALCPICHDAYSSPIALKCGHVFCDDCVGTWFKREQTCPMCRAKVNDDPTYQDGSTTYFYQLF